MKFEFFRNMPPEITTDILSRLPIRSIAICKCVGKPWRDLLRSREFADFHLSRSVPGFVMGYDWNSKNYRVIEFNDELGLEDHDLHYNPVTKFNAMGSTQKFCYELKGSARGLLLFRKTKSPALHICNPITREYINLPSDGMIDCRYPVACGFGVSQITGQYKVVRIFHEKESAPDTGIRQITRSFCLVYVLGTGSWRSIAPPAPYTYDDDMPGVYSSGLSLNGNLHWLVEISKGSYCISCFDLETEIFSTFVFPLLIDKTFLGVLVVLGDCLCLCDATNQDVVVIWLMKEYGDGKSWTKEFVIVQSIPGFREVVYPIKVFKDGDILMALYDFIMLHYSSKTKTSTRIDMFEMDEDDSDYYESNGLRAMLHTSSFLSLRTFLEESVCTF